MRSLYVAFIILMGLGSVSLGQSNKAKAEIEAKNKEAMSQFDGLEFDKAKKLLRQAITVARKNGLIKDPLMARVHLNLGVVYFAGFKDVEAAVAEFTDAIKMDPNIELDDVYRTDQMAQTLLDVKRRVRGDETDKRPESLIGADPEKNSDKPEEKNTKAEDTDRCLAGNALEHSVVEKANRGKEVGISAQLGKGLKDAEIFLYFRQAGKSKYESIPMNKKDCQAEGSISGQAFQGNAVHYYIAAKEKGKVVATSGSSGSPNIIEVAADGESVAGGEEENPFASGQRMEVSDGVQVSNEKPDSFFIAFALGSGAGYVSGQTEVAKSEVGCCVAPALFHLFPEVGYYLTARTSLSAALRMGFVVGANVMGHATAAPSVMLRVRHGLSSPRNGRGFTVNGLVGAGLIRHTVKVQEAPSGMDTDTTASGPFLVGGGVGYVGNLTGSLRYVFELNGILATPMGKDTVGDCPGTSCVEPTTSFEVDANLGLMLGF